MKTGMVMITYGLINPKSFLVVLFSSKLKNFKKSLTLFVSKRYGNFHLPHEVETTFNCLTINIYMPYEQDDDLSEFRLNRNLSVMLFIHGGSNAGGASSYMDCSVLAATGNLIVATINYRVDVLGFFNMPEHRRYLKGNYGLWDQLTAIKWLHHNCQYLGTFFF